MFTTAGRMLRLVPIASLFLTAALMGQEYRASITGSATDPSGAAIVGALVEVRCEETRFLTETRTNEAGAYAAPNLLPGHYRVKIAAPGFKESIRDGIELHSGDKAQIDVRLEVGAATESVTVVANSEMLQTGTASLGQVVNSEQVEDLPLLGRNTFMLASLATGVVSGLYNTKVSSFGRPYDGAASQMSVRGIGGQAYQILLNGVPNAPPERASGATYVGFVPSPDAVEEVNFQSSLYDAQYGHTAGAVVNTVMKGGSNQWHGRIYEFFRNEVLNASSFESNYAGLPKPVMRWNQPGFVLHGPVRIPKLYNGRDKTFFMVSCELIRNSNPTPSVSSVPVAAEHKGDFSRLVQTNGQPIVIYDPRTTQLTGSQYLRQPFAGNLIPASRMNPVGQALMDYFPLPNVPGNNTDFNNLVASPNSQVDKYNSVAVRLDHQLNNQNRLSATVFNNVRHQLTGDNGFPGVASPQFTHFRNNHGGSLDWTDTLSPTLVLNVKYGFMFHPFQLKYDGDGFDSTKLGFPASLISQLPRATFPGVTLSNSYTGLQEGASQFSTTVSHSISGTINKIHGKHTIKTGAEIYVMRANNAVPVSNFGSFSFSAGFTQQNALAGSTSAGNPIASMLLGYPSGGTVNYNIASAYQQLYSGAFIQDDWRPSSRLTLNMGLRWDYESPMSERYDRQNRGFALDATSPLQSQVSGLTLRGGLLFTGPDHRLPFVRDFNNWQPRLGVVYRLFSSTVLRGGFGIMYMPTFHTGQSNGFSVTTSYISSTDGNLTPASSLSNPYPTGIIVPPGKALGLSTLLGQNLTFSDPERTIPKIYQYSFGVQHLFPWKTMVEAGFVGSYASQMTVSRNINALPAAEYPRGSVALTAQVRNPMAGLLPGTALNNATTPLQNLLLPYPEFGTLTESLHSIGNSLYNSMQATVLKRLSAGLQVRTSVTWSKIMQRTAFLNAQDAWSDIARVQNSEPSKLITISGGYTFPFFSRSKGVVNKLLAGWSANVILRYQNGYLVAAPGSAFSSGLNPKLPRDEQSYAQWFNTCSLNTAGRRQNCATADQPVAWIQQPSFTLRTLSTVLPGVRAELPMHTDVSLFKTFVLHESWKLQFRANAYNLPNTPRFAAPSTAFGSATFGLITLNQTNDPRFMELGLKILF